MKLTKMLRLLSVAILAGVLAASPLAGSTQSIVFNGKQADILPSPLSGEAVGVSNISNSGGAVGPSPGPFAPSTLNPFAFSILNPNGSGGFIDNYLFHDEQLNLNIDAGAVRVLRTNQKALLNDFVSGTFVVRNVDPRELRNVLRTVVGLEGGTVEVLPAVDGMPASIEVICPDFMLPYLEAAIPLLDESWLREYDTGSADAYYHAKNRNIGDVDFIASKYLSENGFTLEAYDDPRTTATVYGIPFWVPNTPRHRRGLILHDLHHVATGFGTNLTGEGEISAWELRSGLRGLGWVGGLVILGALMGLIVAPLRTLRAWRLAKGAHNLF